MGIKGLSLKIRCKTSEMHASHAAYSKDNECDQGFRMSCNITHGSFPGNQNFIFGNYGKKKRALIMSTPEIHVELS